jgi:uncharacterized coiled-coil protein SlyX
VADYPLVEAISQNVVKHPVLPDAASRAKLDAVRADTANLTQNAKIIKDYETAIAWREITIRRLNFQITAFTSKIKKLENEKSAANNNLSLLTSTSSTALTTARTICG